jgi:hypothetical protein
MEPEQIVRGFAALASQPNLVLALVGLGLALAPLHERALALAASLFVGGNLAGALGAHRLAMRLPGIESGMADATLLGALACIVAGAALLAPRMIATPATVVAAIGNGVVVGLMIAAKTPAGTDELSFILGAATASISLLLLSVLGRRLLGSADWTGIAGKIVGAWLVAIAGLLLALPASRHSPGNPPPALSALPGPPKAFRSVLPP